MALIYCVSGEPRQSWLKVWEDTVGWVLISLIFIGLWSL